MKHWMILGVCGLLVAGCSLNTEPVYRPLPSQPKKTVPKPKMPPAPPKAEHTLKAVEDNNFSPEYMYPQTDKTRTVHHTASHHKKTAMSKEACIQMIGKEKFDRYTKMLGSEYNAIKRCELLNSMQ